ncbi:MAG: cytidylate kinase-like family protein [Clostridiales bacterium]|nr:cytidylate kinase-like family protein [Clostridiales bacterium]
MSRTIVTISREFGSGGRSIGKAVAASLQIPYYDKELIKQVAEKTGFDPDYIEKAGEYAPGKSIFSLFSGMNRSSELMGGMSASDFLWCMQRQVILELAEKESCVIVGRCADYILKDDPNAFHVFVRANDDFRAERIVRLYGESEKKPLERLRDKDKKRSLNYKHFTGRTWGVCQNYNLSLDSSEIGIDRCVSLIVDLVHEKEARSINE